MYKGFLYLYPKCFAFHLYFKLNGLFYKVIYVHFMSIFDYVCGALAAHSN